jgi:hypothetical protein
VAEGDFTNEGKQYPYRRALSEGDRRSAKGGARPRGPVLRRPGRGAFARAIGEARLGRIGFDQWFPRSRAAA